MKKGIIFDLDGTLWNSSEKVVIAWNRAFEKKGLSLRITDEDMRGFMGKQLIDIARLMFPNVDDEFLNDVLTECSDEELSYLSKVGGTLYPKLEQTLSSLHKSYFLSIVSNCQSGYIEVFLKYYGFEKYFDDIECSGNTGKSKGENIALVVKRNALDKAIYVGDTAGDCEAADAANTPFVHASYGFGKPNRETDKISSIEELSKRARDFFI